MDCQSFIRIFEIALKICEKHLQRGSSKVAAFNFENWYS